MADIVAVVNETVTIIEAKGIQVKKPPKPPWYRRVNWLGWLSLGVQVARWISDYLQRIIQRAAVGISQRDTPRPS